MTDRRIASRTAEALFDELYRLSSERLAEAASVVRVD